MALAIGDDTISSQARREAVIDGLFDLPSMFQFKLSIILWDFLSLFLHPHSRTAKG